MSEGYGGPRWIVDVYGYGPVVIDAATKGAARFAAYRKFREAFGGTFREFLARGVVVQRSEFR